MAEHHRMHLVFLVDTDREVHTHIPWELGRPFPATETAMRLRPGTVLHIVDTVLNALPEREGAWGDLVLAGLVSADHKILPLALGNVREVLDELGLKHY